MNVLHLDDHLPPEDREAAALLRREAERVEPSRGVDLEDVLAAGRRRVSRRRFTGLGAAALAAAVLGALWAGPQSMQRALPAEPGPEVTVTGAERSPSQLYRSGARAVQDAGIEVDGELRWRSRAKNVLAGVPQGERIVQVPGLPELGIPAAGFAAQDYVPADGAILELTTLRLQEPLPAGADYCAYYALTAPDVRCEARPLPEGQLLTLDLVDPSGVAVVALNGSSYVHVESRIGTLGSGPQVHDPRHLPVDVLATLATDPRLRW